MDCLRPFTLGWFIVLLQRCMLKTSRDSWTGSIVLYTLTQIWPQARLWLPAKFLQTCKQSQCSCILGRKSYWRSEYCWVTLSEQNSFTEESLFLICKSLWDALNSASSVNQVKICQETWFYDWKKHFLIFLADDKWFLMSVSVHLTMGYN